MDPHDYTSNITKGMTYGFAEIAIGCIAIGAASSGHTLVTTLMLFPTAGACLAACAYMMKAARIG
ncbi:hypothetical protein BJI49_10830 [Acetobacter pasteurianus]|nr:hypothetical protein A4R89_15025 [Acetobacter ascendens]RCL05389.1 hypothetical protein BJI49_10830 [Acetobacter pasteurianus]GAB31617.1 hypothetical protein APS_2219 [Acetobacter pasteurianus subsp. pasteurianus LMG 1262 = NBRC 106471]GCD51103.1 hypothetical protein NBRC106471_2659 [Acetobacter pasteurianus subsp. pasteurianus LMG 1262 = NBRC 106471]GCD57271.1 hypothetical protein NBRC3222_2608 [Acetobacter pasteurianus NBRC 3222]